MFCQHLTSTLKSGYPSKINHAEYWPFQNQTVTDLPVGIGFNTTLSDSPRQALRSVISGASGPGDGSLDMAGLGQNLLPSGYEMEWQFVQGPENQDVVYIDHCDRQPRMTALSDPSNSRS